MIVAVAEQPSLSPRSRGRAEIMEEEFSPEEEVARQEEISSEEEQAELKETEEISSEEGQAESNEQDREARNGWGSSKIRRRK